MILHYINIHLDYLDKNIHSNTIIVYKGFSNNFIKEISKKHTFLFNNDNIFLNGKIDLDFIKNSYKNILLSIEDFSGIRTMLYEELVLLNSKNINIFDLGFTGKVIVFENSLLEYFPNESNSEFDDIEEKIDNELDFAESILFDFYSNFKKNLGIGVIQYKSIQDDIESFDFYKTLNFLDISDVGEIYNEGITNPIFVGENNKYTKLMFDLYYGNIDEYRELNIVYDSNINISTLYNLLIESGLKVNLYKNIFDSYIYKFTNYREDFNSILKNHWGYDDFRKINFYKNPDISKDKIQISQGSLIEDIVTQVENAKSKKNSSDVFITAPTGAGKSIIFQVPALYLANKYKYVTIVISPLIALMNDQIQALHKKGIYNVDFINSDKSVIEREEIINKIQSGDIDILYLSPELLLSYDISHFLGDQENGGRELGLLVIDEAHLVTTWGRDFRVDYWYLGNYIRKIRKYNYNFSVLSLTATAVYGGEDDMVFETFGSLNMLNPHKYIGNIRRDDIDFKFRPFIYEGNYNTERELKTVQIIEKYLLLGKKSIVYCPYKKHINGIINILNSKGKGLLVGKYYGSGDMDKEAKRKSQEDFLLGNKKVIIATKAFGMGIDVSDIERVYHHAPSGSIPDYVQEIGRLARREDLSGTAEIDYCDKDLNYSKALHGLSSVK
ncbi:MAG: helicase-related protein [Candidatus Gracilibacteria bacterium]|nr:helicase-related protein [Candidatus Gracilibacteria bacterium]